MRKVIAIGESVLDTLYKNCQPVKSFVGGRISNAAASLGNLGVQTTMVSECCTDVVGDIIVKFLEDNNVVTTSIDRYTDGATAISLLFECEAEVKRINYINYPEYRFDVVWPRIDENDIILFGSLYSIDEAQRERLYEMINYAVERKAILIYLPGFQHGIGYRITKVMPAILENIEAADVVIMKDSDINDIFPGETSAETYKNHIQFYCDNYININKDNTLKLYSKKDVCDYGKSGETDNWLGWQAGLVSGVIYSMIKNDVTREGLDEITKETWDAIMEDAIAMAELAAVSAENCITKEMGELKAKALSAKMVTD